MTHSGPAPKSVALAAVARCFAKTLAMVAQGQVHLPRQYVGLVIPFADGTSGLVYRETAVDRQPPADPCVLVVSFRLRAVRGRAHVAFEKESILNTPLFVGFPGFVSKLWMSHDTHGTYRGLYEWDGPYDAEQYARALWNVLALVSVKGSIDYRVLPGLRRDELLADPSLIADPSRLDVRSVLDVGSVLGGQAHSEAGEWWRVVEPA